MLLVHRPHLEQQGSGAGWAEFSCKGPGSTFPGFAGHMVSAQKNICFVDYAKALDSVGRSQPTGKLKEMGIPDHLTCVLRNLYVGGEATVRTAHGTTAWVKIGKGV